MNKQIEIGESSSDNELNPLMSGPKPALPPGTASPLTTLLNLLNCIIGVGVMTLPYCLQTDGYVFGIILFIIMGWFAHMSFVYISQAADATNSNTYKQIAAALFNHPSFGWIIPLIMVLYVSGSLTSYSIALMDNMYWWSADTSQNHTYRVILLVCIMYGVMFPLSCLRSLDFMRFNSYVTIVCEVVITAVIVVYFFIFDEPHAKPVAYVGGFNVFTTFPLVSASMCGHFASPNLYQELKDRSLSKINKVISWNALVLLSLYSLVMLFGYFTFTNLLTNYSDVLKAIAFYASGHWYLQVANIAQMILIICHFPCTCFGCRVAVESLIWRDGRPPLWGSILVVFVVMTIFLVISLFVDQVKDVLDVTSTLCGSFVILTIPGCFGLVLKWKAKARWFEYILPGSIAALGVVQFGTGVVSTIMSWM